MRLNTRRSLWSVLVVTLGCEIGESAESGPGDAAADPTYATAELAAVGSLANLQLFSNPSGQHATFSTAGRTKLSHPFFLPLGTNGRACSTCHEPAAGWSLTPPQIQQRFDATGGTDPLFRPVDTTNNANADVSTVAARSAAYSLFLSRGVVRFHFAPPPGAEFQVLFSDDPYGNDPNLGLTVFRRPLPASGMKFVSSVMWDGRGLDPANAGTGGRTGALTEQALDAHQGHSEPVTDPTAAQLSAIVNLEIGIFTAQQTDNAAGSLTGGGGLGGAKKLATQTGAAGPFTLFNAWPTTSTTQPARAAIRRGQDLFNTMPITMSGVRGLNTEAEPVIQGTCGTCHDMANVGSQTTFSAFDIGVSAASRRTSDVPLHTLYNPTTGESVSMTDPGRAMVTGLWSDLGRFKSPSLRGLASRAPYFHDGSAATIEDVVEFYDGRFQIGMSAEDKADMAAFLRAL